MIVWISFELFTLRMIISFIRTIHQSKLSVQLYRGLSSWLITKEGHSAASELRDNVQEKDEQLMKIASELSTISKEKKELEKEISALKKELEDANGKLISGKDEAFSAGLKSGVELCHRRLFTTFAG